MTALVPDTRQVVVLDVPGRQPVQARVERRRDDELVLALPVTDAFPPELVRGSKEATIEFPTPRGLCRLPGRVGRAAAQVEVVRFEPGGEAEVIQRRAYYRVDAVRPVAIEAPAVVRDGEIETFTHNVSGGGLLLAGPDALGLGDRVRFRLRLEDGRPPLTGTGRVVRITDEGFRAIEFESIDEADREVLVRFVFDRQRLERRLIRGG